MTSCGLVCHGFKSHLSPNMFKSNQLIKTDFLMFKWKTFYFLLFNFLSIILFWKKYSFFYFYFLNLKLNILSLNSTLFNFLLLYDFEALNLNWGFYSFILIYFLIFYTIFLIISFKTALYQIEFNTLMWTFFKIFFTIILIQLYYKFYFHWVTFYIKENFVENFFLIQSTSLSFEIQIFLISLLSLLVFYLYLIFNNNINHFYIKILNFSFILIFLIKLLYIDSLFFFSLEFLIFFFLRYIWIFFKDI